MSLVALRDDALNIYAYYQARSPDQHAEAYLSFTTGGEVTQKALGPGPTQLVTEWYPGTGIMGLMFNAGRRGIWWQQIL